ALAHSSEGAELALPSDGRALAVDLQILEAVVAHADAQGPVAIGGLEVGFPQIRRFEGVAVAIDHEGFGLHHLLLPPLLEPIVRVSTRCIIAERAMRHHRGARFDRARMSVAGSPLPPMIVHLIDGTYELFRHFYGARRFNKGKDRPLGAVLGVLNTVLG